MVPRADARLAALIDVNRQLMGALSPEELLRLLVRSAMDLFSAEGSSIALVDANEKELVFPAIGGDLEGQDLRVPLGRGIIGWVIEHGEPATVNDVTRDARFFSDIDEPTGFETQTILCAPLREGDTVIGAIEVLNTRQSGGFGETDVALVEALAGVAATAIQRTRAEERLRTAHQALRSDSESRHEL